MTKLSILTNKSITALESVSLYKKLMAHFKKHNIDFPYENAASLNSFFTDKEKAFDLIEDALDFFEEQLPTNYFNLYIEFGFDLKYRRGLSLEEVSALFSQKDFSMFRYYKENREEFLDNNTDFFLIKLLQSDSRYGTDLFFDHLIFMEEALQRIVKDSIAPSVVSVSSSNLEKDYLKNGTANLFKTKAKAKKNKSISTFESFLSPNFFDLIGMNNFNLPYSESEWLLDRMLRTSFKFNNILDEMRVHFNHEREQNALANEKINTLKQTVSELKKTIKQNKKSSNEDPKLQKAIDGHLQNIQRLNKENDDLSIELKSIKETNEQLTSENETLAWENNKQKRDIEQLKEELKELAALRGEFKKLSKEHNQLIALSSKEVDAVYPESIEETSIIPSSINYSEEKTPTHKTSEDNKGADFFSRFIENSLDFLFAEGDNLPENIKSKLFSNSPNPVEPEPKVSPVVPTEKTITPEANPNFNKIGPVEVDEYNNVTLHNAKVKNIPAYIFLDNYQFIQVDEFYNFIQAFPCIEVNPYNSLTRYYYAMNNKIYNAADKEITTVKLKADSYLLDGQIIIVSNKDTLVGFAKRSSFDFETAVTTSLNRKQQVFIAHTENDEEQFLNLETGEYYKGTLKNNTGLFVQHESLIIATDGEIQKIINSPHSYKKSSYYTKKTFAVVCEQSYDTFYAETQEDVVVKLNFAHHQNTLPHLLIETGDVIVIDEKNNFLMKAPSTSETKFSNVTSFKKKNKKQSNLDYPEATHTVLIIGNVRYQHSYSTALRSKGIESIVVNGYDSYFNISKAAEKSDIIVVDTSFISHNNMFDIKEDFKNSNKPLIFSPKNGASYICELIKDAQVI